MLLEPSPVEISGKKLSKITDLFSFDEENVGKVCEGDKVLAHWQDGKFIPATVLKKKYIYGQTFFLFMDLFYNIVQIVQIYTDPSTVCTLNRNLTEKKETRYIFSNEKALVYRCRHASSQSIN